MNYNRFRGGERIHLGGKSGTALRVSLDDVWVPTGYKLLKVKHSKADDEDDNICDCCAPCKQDVPFPQR